MATNAEGAWNEAKEKYGLPHLFGSTKLKSAKGSCAVKIDYSEAGFFDFEDESVVLVNIMDDGTWSEVRPETTVKQGSSEIVEGIPCSGGTLGVLGDDSSCSAKIEIYESAEVAKLKTENSELTQKLTGTKQTTEIIGAVKAVAGALIVCAAVVAVVKLAPVIKGALK